MNLYYPLSEHIHYLEEEIHRLTQLQSTRLVELKCYKNRNHFRYYLNIHKANKVQRKIISSKNIKLLKDLAKKTHDYYLLLDYQKELKALQYYLKHFSPNDLKAPSYLANPGIRQLLSDFDQYAQDQWASADYQSNPYFPEQKNIRLTEKLSVRSKSEAHIALALMQKGIPFRYECELLLHGSVFYPDFTIKHPFTGKIIYWEHFGMMHEETYKKRTGEKLQKYISAGFIPGINFITTYEAENHPLDPVAIEEKIKLIMDQMEGF